MFDVFQRTQKPPAATPLDLRRPTLRGTTAFWPMNEGVGSVIQDATGINGPVSINATWAPGLSGPALQFNNSSNVVSLPTSVRSSIAGTVIVRANPSPAIASNSGQILIGGFAYGATTATWAEFRIVGTGYGYVEFGWQVYGTTQINSTYTVPGVWAAGQWTTYACTWENGGLTTAYVNGVARGSTSGTVTNAVIDSTINPPFALGAVAGDNYGGLIDYVFVSDRVLSPGEIAEFTLHPWSSFSSPSYLRAVSTIVPELTPGAVVYANGTSQVVPLTAFDHTLTVGSSPFSITGTPPAGVSITAQSVTTTSQGSVTLATGSTAGPLSITDGTATASVSILATSISPTPTIVPTNHPGHITLTLTGNGTSWVSGTTTFAFSGTVPTGCSLVSQSVASATSATVVITTGSGTGPLTITDGVSSGTVQVDASALSVSIQAPATVATGDYTIVFSNPAAVWTQETASTLFSISGWTGASLANIIVDSDHVASAALTLGTTLRTAGSATITDNSTGATTTFPITAALSGSIRAVETTVLAHTGGQTGLFSLRASATLGVWIRFNNPNLPIPYTPITLLGWTTGTGPNITYYPASQELTLAFPIASGGVNATTIAVQPGTGYFFGFVCSPGEVTIYLNGVLLASAANTGADTATCSGLQIGPSTSEADPTDISLHDLFVLSNYAATSADMANLASGAATPVSLPGAASAWWPLGGGTAGATPTLTDPAMSDLTGNGNTLSVLTGSLSSLTYGAVFPTSDPFLRSDVVSKCGKLVFFGMTSSYAAPGAGYQPAAIAAVNATPTVYRHGTPITVGPPTWSGDMPVTARLLQCGSITGFDLEDGGEGFTAPTVSWVSGSGGGTALTLGTPVLATGVATYGIVNAGVGWSSAPSITVMPQPPGWNTTPVSPIQATARTDAANGALTLARAGAGGLLGPGSGYTIGETITLSIGTGSGCQLTPTWSAGVLQSVAVTATGKNYGDVWIVPVDPTGAGSGAILTATITSGGISAVGVVSGAGGTGYSTATTFVIVPAWTFTGSTTSGSATLGVPAGTDIFAGQGIYGTGIPIGATATTGTAFTGFLSQTSSTITGCSSLAGISVGAAISGNNIPSGTTISSISGTTVTMNQAAPKNIGTNVPVVVTATGLTSVTLSAAATATGSPTLTAFNPTQVWARVGTYIQSLPVVSSSNDFTGPPSFTITDSPTPTRTATLLPFFSGVNAGDVVTYDAPASWLAPQINGYPLGGIGPVTGQPIVNGATILEPAAGGLSAFAQPMTMPAGANEGGGHLNSSTSMSPLRNQTYNAYWQASNVNQGPASTLTFASTPVSYNADPGTGGIPASWTNPLTTTIEKEVMVPGGPSNNVDGMGVPGPIGQWALTYSDPNVNTANATWVILSTYYGGYFWGQSNYVNQSGPNAGTTTGIVINSADIKFSGGSLQSITVNSSSLTSYGSGWEGAIVVASGGSTYANPWAIAVLPLISNGEITGFDVLMGGAGFTTNPTLTVYGTAVSGTQVTIVNDIQYPGAFDTLGSYEVRPNIRVAAASGTWQISNLAVTTPDQFTGQPQTFSPSVPLAGNTSFLGALAGGTNRYAACVRYMGATEGPAGQTNAAYDACLLNPAADNWQQQELFGFTMTEARCFNPDPSSTIYSWSSPKIYGPQAAFPLTDPSFAITGTTTLGSLNVTGVTGPSLMVGSTITGPGIPSGPQGQPNYISMQFSGGFRLGYAATASGTSSLTVTNPPYFTVPPTDIGEFWGDPNMLRYNTVVEFVTSVPHNMTSGHTVSLGGGSVPIPIEGIGLYSGASGRFPVLVTGPSTFLTRVPAGYYAAFSRVASNVPIDLTAGGTAAQSWVGNTTWPAYNGAAMPHTAAAQITAALPGCTHWVTLPPLGTDGVFGAIARELAGTLDASNPVLMEYGNELWNDATNCMTDFPRALNNIPAATTPGQISFDGYMSDGTSPAVTGWNPGMTTLLGDHAYKTFEAAWAAAGMAPSRVKRVAGSFMIDAGGTTASHLDMLARAGSYVDYVAVAPYMDLPGDGTVVAAFAPGGSLDNAGAWPIDAINDFIRYWMVYSTYYQSLWEQQNQQCRAFGQPQFSLQFAGSAAVEAVLTPTTIAAVTVNTNYGGSGYSSSTTATLYGGGGPTTSITPVFTGNSISGFTGLPTTANWTSAPWVAITDPTGAGSGAMATAAISPTSVASLVVVDPGVGYGQPGAVAIEALIAAPPSGTTAQAGAVTLSGSGVSAVALTSGGSGYTAPPSVSLYGGGVLPTGSNNAYNTYSCSYTYVDGSGNETTAGFSRTQFSIQTLSGTTVPNNMVVAQSPSLPAWASAMNFYITNGGQPGSETFYLSVSRSEWVAAKGRIPFNLPLPSAGARKAPLTCQVPASTIGTIPKVVTYEGAVEQPIPVTVPYYFYLLHDLVSHPAYHDTIQGWHFACQTGAQWITPPGGAVLSNYFMVFNTISVPFTGTYDTWDLAYSAQIPAGIGTSNQYATNQGTTPGNGHDRWGGINGYGNVSTGLQGFKDWIEKAAPVVLSTVPASAADVAVRSAISVVFSNTMDPATLALTLTGPGGPISLMGPTWNGTTYTATWTPTASLPAASSFSASVQGNNVQGLAITPYSWTFDTVYPSPVVVTLSPAPGAIGVGVGSSISVTLSGAASAAITLDGPGGTPVSGTSTFASGIVTFVPTSNLSRYTVYTPTVTASAADGTAMTPYSWSFTSQANAPTVTTTTPASSATLVNPYATISATFSEPVNPLTLELTLSPSAQVSPVTWNPTTLTATWAPIGSGLAYATSFSATVSATEVDGTTMTAPYNWSFATHQAPPSGYGVVLGSGYTFGAGSGVTASTLSATVTAPDGSTVSATASYDPNSGLVNIVPSAPFTAGSRYVVQISGLRNPNGSAVPTLVYTMIPGPQRETGWIGGLGTPIH